MTKQINILSFFLYLPNFFRNHVFDFSEICTEMLNELSLLQRAVKGDEYFATI